MRENSVTALVLSPEARPAGVVLETLADLRARDPELMRRLLEGGCALPENDKLAQMTRALWSDGLLLHVPERRPPGAADRPALGGRRAGHGAADPDGHLDRRGRRGLDP